MPFKILTPLIAVICLILAGVWFALPDWILAHWQVVHAEGGALVSRRMACLFLALGVILLGVRRVTVPEVQRAVGNGIIAACGSLIALGVYELASGHAGNGIFFAIGLESTICLAFVTVGRFSGRAVAEPAVQFR